MPDTGPREAIRRSDAPPKTVYVCTGKSCRKRDLDRAKALEALGDDVPVKKVRCQKICKGPVFGVEVDGRLEWFKNVDGNKSRVGLRLLAEAGELVKALAKRRGDKRRGQLR